MRRSLDFQRNRISSCLRLFFGLLFILYLIGMSIGLALVAKDESEETAVEIVYAILPFILFTDFILRFTIQETPAQIIKPYILLPFSTKRVIDAFVLETLLSWGNLLWFAMLIPYCIMALHPLAQPLVSLQLIFVWWAIILANSQWYLICRTLIYRSWVWGILPVVYCALPFAPLFFFKDEQLNSFFDNIFQIASPLLNNGLLMFLAVLLVLFILIAFNRKLQWQSVSKEILKNSVSKEKVKTPSLSFLGRYGNAGLYLKLEILSILRNPAVRKRFIMSILISILFSLLCAFTDIYEGDSWNNFWCLYCFMIGSVTLITTVMQPEGNYIDMLMTHKQSILTMLHAKYIFNFVLLVIPFIILLPTVFTGKWPIFMVISFMVYTAGIQFFLMFQLAVYNKRTLSLTSSLSNKDGNNNSTWQIMITMLTFIIPMALVTILNIFAPEEVTYSILCLLSIIFIATERLWMKNIYKRMMARKYENLEGFHSTRQQ
jgi:hypothetical protein